MTISPSALPSGSTGTARVRINHRDVLHGRNPHALTGLDCSPIPFGKAVPRVILPDALGNMAIGFGETVGLRNIEAQLSQSAFRVAAAGGAPAVKTSTV